MKLDTLETLAAANLDLLKRVRDYLDRHGPDPEALEILASAEQRQREIEEALVREPVRVRTTESLVRVRRGLAVKVKRYS